MRVYSHRLKWKKILGISTMTAAAYWLFLLLQPPVLFEKKRFFNVTKIKKDELYIYKDQKTGHMVLKKKPGDYTLSLLQLTDIHLGGSYFSIKKDSKALFGVYQLLLKSKPDLVVVTGDLVYPALLSSFSFNNGNAARLFCELMEKAGIYWVITYGNHDTELFATHNAQQLTTLLKSYPHCLLYPEVGVYGRSNQVLELCNEDGTLNQALILMDSHSYHTFFRGQNMTIYGKSRWSGMRKKLNC